MYDFLEGDHFDTFEARAMDPFDVHCSCCQKQKLGTARPAGLGFRLAFVDRLEAPVSPRLSAPRLLS